MARNLPERKWLLIAAWIVAAWVALSGHAAFADPPPAAPPAGKTPAPLTPVEARGKVGEGITVEMTVQAAKNRLEKRGDISLDSEPDFRPSFARPASPIPRSTFSARRFACRVS
jgi:hypothetical protein